MNGKFIKKAIKIVGATAIAGLGMFMGDRIADDKPVFGKIDDDDNDTVKMPDISEEAEKFTEEDITVEDVKEETTD